MRATLAAVALVFSALMLVCTGPPATAAEGGGAQRKAASQATPAPAARPADLTTLNERVIALEKENLVLREDLGKARLDLRTGLADQAKKQSEEMSRMQQRVDALNAQLAAEREKQSKRSRNMWIAIGLLALGVVAAN